MPTAAPAKPKADPAPDTQQPKAWHVVLLDDDDHSYDYVIEMMQALFAYPIERAFQIAKTVDDTGRVVVFTAHKEHAELKRDQIHAYGPDRRMARSKGAMSAVLEPAEFEGDEGSDQSRE